MKIEKIYFFYIIAFFFFPMNSYDKVEYTMRSFKKEFAKVSLKFYKKTNNREYIDKTLSQVLNFAPKGMLSEWEAIVEQAKNTKDHSSYKKSCKTCHSKYKRVYKKKYRKKTYVFSRELISYLKEGSRK